MADQNAADEFRRIVDSIPGLVFTCHPGGETEYINRELCAYLGYTLEELCACGGNGAVHPDDLAFVTGVQRENIAAGKAHCYQERLRRADGAYHWFEVRCSPCFDAAGQLIRWYGCLTDIDAIKSAEDDSRTNERMLLLLMDSIPSMAFTTREVGDVEWVNRATCAYFGRPLEELQAWRMTDAVHADDLAHVISEVERGLLADLPFNYELRLRRHDGVYRWFHYRAAPVRDNSGRAVRWYGLVTDIDDFKRAQEESRLSEKNLRFLIDTIPGLVYTMTSDCQLDSVNGQVLAYFGKSFEDLKNWDLIGCVHPEDLPHVIESLRRTVQFGEPHEVEQRLLGADGVYRWFKPRAFGLRDADGGILRWYCLLIDIDDLKRAEEGFRSIQARLSRAAQLAAVSELAASIAHEVNQPLAAVVANGHACHLWLSADPPNIERALLSAERIIRDGNSAAEIVARIRSLFKHAAPAKQDLRLNDVIEEVCRLIADDARGKGISLRLELQPDLPQVAADRVQMQQVIANLTRNGIDATEGVQGRAKEITISSMVSGGEIVVRVSDAGEGLRDATTIFEPFFTTKAQGMGMGLAICKSILDAHHGRLWATQNPVHGATFAFALCAATTAGSPPAVRS
ncbi:MAG: PAS domain-containing protein [Pseudomonadota bacterium]